jgi:hypothetical protein
MNKSNIKTKIIAFIFLAIYCIPNCLKYQPKKSYAMDFDDEKINSIFINTYLYKYTIERIPLTAADKMFQRLFDFNYDMNRISN